MFEGLKIDVFDARGEPRPMMTKRMIRAHRRSGTGVDTKTFYRIVQKTIMRERLWWSGALLAGLTSAIFAHFSHAASYPVRILGVLMLSGKCGASILHMQLRVAPRRPTFVSLMVEESLCPSCGAFFASVTPESDGCVVCQVCGGAWRCDTA